MSNYNRNISSPRILISPSARKSREPSTNRGLKNRLSIDTTPNLVKNDLIANKLIAK